MGPNDVMDVFVLIIIDSWKKEPYPYMRCATITCSLALLMSKVEHTAKDSLTMIVDAVHLFIGVKLILISIILNRHFHLLVLDKGKKEYIHYSSVFSLTYDADAVNMANNVFVYNFLLFSSPLGLTDTCSIDRGNYSIDVWQLNLERQPQKSNPSSMNAIAYCKRRVMLIVQSMSCTS